MNLPVRATDRNQQLNELVAKAERIQQTLDNFHRLYYAPAHESTYLGLPLWKSPLDMFVYQELIWSIKPRVIIECGTAFGASALFLAHFTEKAGIETGIVSIDIAEGDSFQGSPLPRHERITYLRGLSSVAPEVLRYVDGYVEVGAPVLVILDSDHRKDHVLAELNAYSGFVSPGSYLVVEDTNVNGHPVFPTHGPGPFEAVEEWLPAHPEFEQMAPFAKYLVSFHHAGWLRRAATGVSLGRIRIRHYG